MSFRYNPRTGANEWVDDGRGGQNTGGTNQGGSYNTGANPLPPGAAPQKPVDPSNGSWGFGASGDYDPNAAFLGRKPGLGNQMATDYQRMARETDQRGAPWMDRTQDLQSRGYVTEGIGMMGQRALGLGLSPAEEMQRRATMEAQGAQAGMAASARGGPAMAALAARNASGQMQQLGVTGALQEQQLRAQQMEQARQALFRQTSGLRGQDIGQAQSQADIQLRGMAANDARAMAMDRAAQGLQQRETGSLMGQQEILQGDYEGGLQRQMADRASQNQQQQQYINMGVGMGMGTMQAGMSAYQPNPQQPRQRNPYDPYDPGYNA